MNAIEQLDRQIDRLETKLEALREARQIFIGSTLSAEPPPVVPVAAPPTPPKPQAAALPKKLIAQPAPGAPVGWAGKIAEALRNGPMSCADITKAINCPRHGTVFNRLKECPHLFRRCSDNSQLWELCPPATTTEPPATRSMPTSSMPSASA